jgi:hypothetical protein
MRPPIMAGWIALIDRSAHERALTYDLGSAVAARTPPLSMLSRSNTEIGNGKWHYRGLSRWTSELQAVRDEVRYHGPAVIRDHAIFSGCTLRIQASTTARTSAANSPARSASP